MVNHWCNFSSKGTCYLHLVLDSFWHADNLVMGYHVAKPDWCFYYPINVLKPWKICCPLHRHHPSFENASWRLLLLLLMPMEPVWNPTTNHTRYFGRFLPLTIIKSLFNNFNFQTNQCSCYTDLFCLTLCNTINFTWPHLAQKLNVSLQWQQPSS